MSWVATAVIGGGIISGLIGQDASRSAANTAADASRNAAATQLQMFNQTQANLKPYMQAGLTPLSQLGQQFGTANSPGNQPFVYESSPDFNFILQQGQDAINKYANARGNYYAPQTLQDLTKYSQGIASEDYQTSFRNYLTEQNTLFNRLHTLASGGQNAAAGLGTLGANMATNVGAAQQNAGAYQAAGILGQGQAISGALAQGGNAALQAYLLSQNQGLYGNPAAGQAFNNMSNFQGGNIPWDIQPALG